MTYIRNELVLIVRCILISVPLEAYSGFTSQEMEGRLGTSMQYDTFGFTAAELARKQAEKEQKQRCCIVPKQLLTCKIVSQFVAQILAVYYFLSCHFM